ncbi:hypothetical protein L249_7614 [Ophiocordyceps polyrhachis-furcata BCC 54312]|uniref:Uncharacterized protein n=1 Tax=Ophiocordyceps polyrhachis-furcata BCC 54312 TaxID=1330021 RepID=A0A367LBF8_9HYPO|nr:hypothetical protein L249_7614 [Ophiocordyceps polyrhachis-furcata BCC 54312]
MRFSFERRGEEEWEEEEEEEPRRERRRERRRRRSEEEERKRGADKKECHAAWPCQTHSPNEQNHKQKEGGGMNASELTDHHLRPPDIYNRLLPINSPSITGPSTDDEQKLHPITML